MSRLDDVEVEAIRQRVNAAVWTVDNPLELALLAEGSSSDDVRALLADRDVLRAERDNIQAELAVTFRLYREQIDECSRVEAERDDYRTARDDVVRQLDREVQRVAALEAALREYAWHKVACLINEDEGADPCTCGLAMIERDLRGGSGVSTTQEDE